MRQIDVFNGDADGLCALHQLRLAYPVNAEIITGVKRDIKLLDRVQAEAGDRVTVLDISLDSNRNALLRLLDAGASVEYFDHHHAGDIPTNPNLVAHIDLSAQVCTSILVDRHLGGKYRLWAITAAFGDNLRKSARSLAEAAGLSDQQIDQLARLGEYLNYNGYGESLEDLHFHPAKLYEEIKPFSDPFAFIAESNAFALLEAGFNDDSARANALRPIMEKAHCAAYLLPNAPWANRMSGILANKLANDSPERAHAVLTHNKHGGYTVSVRSPVSNQQGADLLCLKFETGGGRKAAAGINRLPESALDKFMTSFTEQFSG